MSELKPSWKKSTEWTIRFDSVSDTVMVSWWYRDSLPIEASGRMNQADRSLARFAQDGSMSRLEVRVRRVSQKGK